MNNPTPSVVRVTTTTEYAYDKRTVRRGFRWVRIAIAVLVILLLTAYLGRSYLVARIVEKNLPHQFPGSGYGPDLASGTYLGFGHWSVGSKYDYTATRGPVTVSNAVGIFGLAVQVPVQVSGHGGLRGDVARWASADAKNFDGKGTFDVSAHLTFAPDLCPHVIGTTTVENLKASVEIVSGTRIGIADMVGPDLKKAFQDAVNGAGATVGCEWVRRTTASAWAKLTK